MIDREQIRLDVKRRLNRYHDLNEEAAQIRDELVRLEQAMTSPAGPNMDGMPRSPGAGNPVERMVIKHITLQERYTEQLARIVAEQEQIEAMIENLDSTERRLARYRYIDGLTWDNVCIKMNYSWRQTHRIHARMLDKLVDRELEKMEAPE